MTFPAACARTTEHHRHSRPYRCARRTCAAAKTASAAGTPPPAAARASAASAGPTATARVRVRRAGPPLLLPHSCTQARAQAQRCGAPWKSAGRMLALAIQSHRGSRTSALRPSNALCCSRCIPDACAASREPARRRSRRGVRHLRRALPQRELLSRAPLAPSAWLPPGGPSLAAAALSACRPRHAPRQRARYRRACRGRAARRSAPVTRRALPQGACCASSGVCAPDASPECRSAVCQPDVSGPSSSECRRAYERQGLRVVRYSLTLTYGQHAPVAGNPARRVGAAGGRGPAAAPRASSAPLAQQQSGAGRPAQPRHPLPAGRLSCCWRPPHRAYIHPQTPNPSNQLILVNGMWPAPTLNITYGDRVIIVVHNRLDVPTSLHSHGLIQREEITMDGLVGVTQRCVGRGRDPCSLAASWAPRRREGAARTGGCSWAGAHSGTWGVPAAEQGYYAGGWPPLPIVNPIPILLQTCLQAHPAQLILHLRL